MGRRKHGLFRLDREHSTAFHSPSAHSQWGYLKDVPSPNTAFNQSTPADRHAEVIPRVGQATGPKAAYIRRAEISNRADTMRSTASRYRGVDRKQQGVLSSLSVNTYM